METLTRFSGKTGEEANSSGLKSQSLRSGSEREKRTEALNGEMYEESVKYVCVPRKAAQGCGYWWCRVRGRTEAHSIKEERDKAASWAHQKLRRQVRAKAAVMWFGQGR